MPKLGDVAEHANEADIALFEEDAYLIGLVENALGNRTLEVSSIDLSNSIDHRLRIASKRFPQDQVLAEMVDYRASMRDLAALLSAFTGVPLKSARNDSVG